eukprot:Rhum_TRINITY_DN23602_c0_g1::Rhum_TRINITY_DN23602_c0_g1_i1::g.178396::m.178396
MKCPCPALRWGGGGDTLLVTGSLLPACFCVCGRLSTLSQRLESLLRNVKHDRRLHGFVAEVAGGGVDEGRVRVARRTVALVDVAEDVVLRPDPPVHVAQQVDAAGPVVAEAQVAVPDGRPVRQQHVGVLRDLPPQRVALGASPRVEAPVVEPRRPRRAPDLDALHHARRVLQVVRCVRQRRPARRRVERTLPVEARRDARVRRGVEGRLVVSSDHHLVLVRQRAEPVVEGLAHAELAGVREVAAVDQDVAGRQGRHVCLAAVRVADAHKAHRVSGLLCRRQRVRVHLLADALDGVLRDDLPRLRRLLDVDCAVHACPRRVFGFCHLFVP